MDWITGEKFQNIGDFTYAPPLKSSSDYNNLPNTLNMTIKDNDSIYTHGLYINELLNIVRFINKQVIIITHNCDYNIGSNYIVPDNVIKWYGQNINVINPKIESIPIGLENPWWFIEEHKKDKMLLKLETEKSFYNLVYVNHNIETNPNKRIKPYEVLRGKSFATVRSGLNGSGFDDYLDNIYNHKFVVCPEGNGIDTHRTWECLYMNTIPIEKRNINNQFYTDLPICFVDDWDELTETFLENEYTRITNTKWNMDKLQFEYWKNKIKNK